MQSDEIGYHGEQLLLGKRAPLAHARCSMPHSLRGLVFVDCPVCGSCAVSRSRALQLFDYHQMPFVVGDAGGEEWELEEICDDRKLDDGSVKLLVKWKGGEET